MSTPIPIEFEKQFDVKFFSVFFIWVETNCMRKTLPASLALILTVALALVPFTYASADTAYSTELVVNGGAEAGSISGWTDETGQSRWGASQIYSNWAPPAEGSWYFFLYNPSMESLSGDMSQWITLSGTEGTGLFASISAGNVSMDFSLSMYQKISAGNEVKGVVEQYSASNTLLATSNLVNTTAGSGAFGAYSLNTQLDPSTRKLKLIMSATLTLGGYAEFDAISLKLADASADSAPVFGSDFPASGTTNAGVAYSHGFTITDSDAGDIDILTFNASSTNVNLVPAANVAVTGTGTSRTLTITPVSGLSGEADITVTASDGVKSADATIHLVVSKVISLGTNLVENGNATSGFASWEGSTVNITATGNGFAMISPGTSMYQDLDVSKYSNIINGGAMDFTLSATFPGTYGKVTAQCYSDIACTSTIGSMYTVSSGASSTTKTLPAGTMGVRITFSNTSNDYNTVTIRNISFILLDNFPKMTAISAQTTTLASLTVPVHMYYTTSSATLTAVSGNQTIVTNGGIAASGSGYDRSLTFTPLTEGTVTITATVTDGDSDTASQAFTVTVHDPATITSVDKPAAGYYGAGNNLDFTAHFSRSVQGGTASTLPLTVGGYDADASYLSSTADSITYRYTLASDDEGAVVLGTAIDDSTSPITDTSGYDAELDFSGGSAGITAIPKPEVVSNATGDETEYGTQATFTCSLTCADTLAGTVQFQADGVNIGSPVSLSGNQASYQTAATTLDAGSPAITGVYIPSGTNYRFTSLTSSSLSMTITQKPLTVSGLAATPKTYDGSAAVVLSGGTISGVLAGDSVSANYPTAGTASSANVGTQSVFYSAVTLSGTDKDNYAIMAQQIVNVTISQAPITFTATAADKPYDGTTAGTVSGVVFDGLVSGETLASGVDYSASAIFDSAGVGESIPVTVTVTLLSTTKAGNYTLSESTADTQADITRKELTITGVTATNRVYDGDTTIALTGGTLVGVAPGDAGSVGFTLGNGSVASANAGSAKPVTTAITLTGDAAGSYTLKQPDYVTVTISKAPLTLSSAAAADKAYDGNTDATVTDVSVSGTLPGETLTFQTDYTATGAFSNADVGADKTVTVTVSLAGTAAAGNYTFPTNTITTTASITNSGVTITGVTATDRAYDGTVSVALTGGTLVGIKPTDTADVGFTLNAGAVTGADIGSAKPVTTNIVLTGSKAGNYTLTQPDGITVSITAAPLTITGATVENKPYDSTTAATVTGVTFSGLATGESLTLDTDYTANGVFDSAAKGTAIPVTVSVTLAGTALSGNYTVSGTYSASANITALSLSGTVAIDATNTTGDAILIDEGDVLSVNTDAVSVPGTLTYDCQWYRNGTAVPGATGVSCTVGSLAADPIGTEYTVKITGTGNYQDTLESAAVTVEAVSLGGSVSITGDTALGDTLTLDTSALTPASATYDIQWFRDDAPIAGATLAAYIITKPDQDTTISVTVTGNGYFTGSRSATIDVPPSPYVPDTGIEEKADVVTVDMTLGKTLLSAEQMALLYTLNANKPVVFNGNGYAITYPIGAMQLWVGELDLGILFNAGTDYSAIVSAAGSDFVLMLEFIHSGALPGEAQISIYIGDIYAGQTMCYLYYNPLTGKLDLVQLVVVDEYGWIAVAQDHCSSYCIARLNMALMPQTGDDAIPALWWTLACLCAAGLLALIWSRPYMKL